MSLTRAEWIEMWESIKNIEECALWLDTYTTRKVRWYDEIKKETEKIKEQIQSVIGQME